MDKRKFGSLLKEAAKGWVDDRAMSMGAALSYYTVFSVAPLLLIVISLAGLFLGEEAARGAIVQQINGLVGQKGAEAVQAVLASVAEPKQGTLATLVGVVLLLVGATTVFAELQQDLNRIWQVEDGEQPSGVWALVRARLLSIGMIMAIGFLLLVSLVLSAGLAALGEWYGNYLQGWTVVLHVLNFVISFGIVTTLFALIYRFMPQVRIEWHDVWIGAAFTSLMFSIGKWLIGLYIGKSAVASGFGAAGSLAVLLVWVYYSAQIFLFGAEFTWAYAHRYGSRKPESLPVDPAQPAGAVAAPVPLPNKRQPAKPPLSPLPLPPAPALQPVPLAAALPLARRPLSRLLAMVTVGALGGAAARLAAEQLKQRRPSARPWARWRPHWS